MLLTLFVTHIMSYNSLLITDINKSIASQGNVGISSIQLVSMLTLTEKWASPSSFSSMITQLQIRVKKDSVEGNGHAESENWYFDEPIPWAENSEVLRNVGNTCYMDSILFCLMALFPNFIKSTVTKMAGYKVGSEIPYSSTYCVAQQQPNGDIVKLDRESDAITRTEFAKSLLELYTNIASNNDNLKSCKVISHAIRSCQPSATKSSFLESSKKMEDASEFLQYVLNILDVQTVTQMSTYYAVQFENGKVKTTIKTAGPIKHNTTPVIVMEKNYRNRYGDFIRIQDNPCLGGDEYAELDSLNLSVIDGIKYNGRMERKELDVTGTDFLFIDTNRYYHMSDVEQVNSTVLKELNDNGINTSTGYEQGIMDENLLSLHPVEFDRLLYIGKATLLCVAAIVLQNAHYIVYYQRNGQWYKYNDLSIVQAVTEKDDIAEMERNIRHRATLLCYRKLDDHHIPMLKSLSVVHSGTTIAYEGFYWYHKNAPVDVNAVHRYQFKVPGSPNQLRVFESSQHKDAFIAQLDVAENSGTVEMGNPWWKCPICGAEPSKMGRVYTRRFGARGLVRWTGLRHYADVHNIKPSDEFVDIILK